MGRATVTGHANAGADEAPPFSYRATAGGKVFIDWQGRAVKVLKDIQAERFLARVTSANAQTQQLAMAKITGNFKRGNER